MTLTQEQKALGDEAIPTFLWVVRKRKAQPGEKLYDSLVTCYLWCCRKYRSDVGVTFRRYAKQCLLKVRE